MAQLTLEEIGARAGVSRSTVSRVVNGDTNVSDAARKRVQAVVAETGYRPHAAARSLASKRTGVIGLLIPNAVATLFDDPYFGRLILGVSAAADAADMTLALLTIGANHEESVVSRVITPGLVDGVVVTATRSQDPLIAQLSKSGLPFVVVGRPDEGNLLATVDVDNRGGAKSAAQHLIESGHRRLGMIGAPANTAAGNDRRDGFLAGLADANLSLDGGYAEGDWSPESGERAMNELLGSSPDAVFVASDRMAIGALRALQDNGLRCPEDVAMVSFDGLIPVNQTNPRLTSVEQPVQRVGERAVELLRSVIDGKVEHPEHVVFSTKLIVRESCGASMTSGS